jgi:putative membrane protein insertion efficiency factor
MKKIFTFSLAAYKNTLSWILKILFGGGCRFQPTCSEYAKESIERFGPFKGTSLALRRLSRCHPWGAMGYDPVPKRFEF